MLCVRMLKRSFVLLVLWVAVWMATSLRAHSKAATRVTLQQTPAVARKYVGSRTCGDCHIGIYERWAKTRMANVVTDPRVLPQVVIPDFSKADPLLSFKLD